MLHRAVAESPKGRRLKPGHTETPKGFCAPLPTGRSRGTVLSAASPPYPKVRLPSESQTLFSEENLSRRLRPLSRRAVSVDFAGHAALPSEDDFASCPCDLVSASEETPANQARPVSSITYWAIVAMPLPKGWRRNPKAPPCISNRSRSCLTHQQAGLSCSHCPAPKCQRTLCRSFGPLLHHRSGSEALTQPAFVQPKLNFVGFGLLRFLGKPKLLRDRR